VDRPRCPRVRGVTTATFRIHFRYLLPLVFLPLSATLFLIGHQQQRGIEVGSWDGPPPRPTEIAVALNIPAGIAAIPGGLLLELATGGFGPARRRTWWQDGVGHFYLALFVVGQWFVIGRWVDLRRGLLPSSNAASALKASKIVHVTALVGSLFFAGFGVWHISQSGWMSSWISGAGITAWSSIAAIAFIFRLRRLISSSGQGASQRD